MTTEPQFAGVFTMADRASIDGQRRQMRMLRFELGTVLVGAFLGAIDDRTSRIIAAVAALVHRQGPRRCHQEPRWGLAVLLLECAGATMAVVSLGNMEGFGPFGPGTLLGVVASLIAAATAWTQAKQFSNLAAAYTIAHQELTSIRGLLARPIEDEAQWAAFVDSAEGAISREHTMWRAARAGGVG